MTVPLVAEISSRFKGFRGLPDEQEKVSEMSVAVDFAVEF